MEKLLICGDSFSADWTIKHTGIGWPNMLANDYLVINLSQAGCSEYKIYLQLKSVDLKQFDRIIISHTSPYRICVERHPIHSKDILHKDCDLIYTDLKEHADSHPEVQPMIDFFEKYFHTEYFEFIHHEICEKIEQMVKGLPVLHLINFDKQYDFDTKLDLTKVIKTNPGNINHFDELGNLIAYKQIKSMLKKI